MFFQSSLPFYLPTNNVWRFCFSMVLPIFLYYTHSNGTQWYLIVVLMCIFLMTSNFLCAIHYLLFDEMPIQTLCSFFLPAGYLNEL